MFQYKTLFQEVVESMETEVETAVEFCLRVAVESIETEVEAVDICPERMDAADAEAPRPPRIETVVEFCSGMGVETAARMQVVYTCPERMYAVNAEILIMRRFF